MTMGSSTGSPWKPLGVTPLDLKADGADQNLVNGARKGQVQAHRVWTIADLPHPQHRLPSSSNPEESYVPLREQKSQFKPDDIPVERDRGRQIPNRDVCFK